MTEDCVEGVNVFIVIIYLYNFQNLLKERDTFFAERPYDWTVLWFNVLDLYVQGQWNFLSFST